MKRVYALDALNVQEMKEVCGGMPTGHDDHRNRRTEGLTSHEHEGRYWECQKVYIWLGDYKKITGIKCKIVLNTIQIPHARKKTWRKNQRKKRSDNDRH